MTLRKSDTLSSVDGHSVSSDAGAFARMDTEGLELVVSGLPKWLSYEAKSDVYITIVSRNSDKIFKANIENSNEQNAPFNENCIVNGIESGTSSLVFLLHIYLEIWIYKIGNQLVKKFNFLSR